MGVATAAPLAGAADRSSTSVLPLQYCGIAMPEPAANVNSSTDAGAAGGGFDHGHDNRGRLLQPATSPAATTHPIHVLDSRTLAPLAPVCTISA